MSCNACQRCSSGRILNISGKCSDMCDWGIAGLMSKGSGYVPRDMNVGGGDYMELSVCLQCGQAQGRWPVPPQKEEIVGAVSAEQAEEHFLEEVDLLRDKLFHCLDYHRGNQDSEEAVELEDGMLHVLNGFLCWESQEHVLAYRWNPDRGVWMIDGAREEQIREGRADGLAASRTYDRGMRDE